MQMTKPQLILDFASGWLRGCRNFSGPGIEDNGAEGIKYRSTFDTQLKIAFLCNSSVLP